MSDSVYVFEYPDVSEYNNAASDEERLRIAKPLISEYQWHFMKQRNSSAETPEVNFTLIMMVIDARRIFFCQRYAKYTTDMVEARLAAEVIQNVGLLSLRNWPSILSLALWVADRAPDMMFAQIWGNYPQFQFQNGDDRRTVLEACVTNLGVVKARNTLDSMPGIDQYWGGLASAVIKEKLAQMPAWKREMVKLGVQLRPSYFKHHGFSRVLSKFFPRLHGAIEGKTTPI